VAVPELIGGHLPAGRHVCSLAEFESTFVSDGQFAESTTRAALWQQFQLGLQLLSSAVTVYQLWIGGSFTSGKLNPGDVDVTFLIDGRDHFTRSTPEQRIIEAFIQRFRDPATGEVRRPHGLALDSFVVDWWPWEPKLEVDEQPWGEELWQQYLFGRGQWDDWWLRRRSGTKEDPAALEDSLPRRGFLEVMLRDFAI
jgi:hypothetical protein